MLKLLPRVLRFTTTAMVFSCTSVAHSQFGGFAPHQEFDAGENPTSIAVGDVNGDGMLDLVVSNTAIDSISILLGNGDGTFQPRFVVENWKSFETNAQHVSLGDLNSDGILDLAIAPWGYPHIMLGHGDGTFDPPYYVPTQDDPMATVYVEDVTHNGHLDLVGFSGSTHTAEIIEGNGDGTFQPGFYPYYPIVGPAALAVGDLNNDGLLDVVVTAPNPFHDSLDPAEVYILFNEGDGSFAPPLVYDLISGWPFLVNMGHPAAVAIGTVSEFFSFLPVLAIAHRTDNAVSVRISDAPGEFETSFTLAAGGEPSAIAMAPLRIPTDMTHNDIIVANAASDTISVILGHGIGEFEDQQQFDVGPSPSALAVADFNGDGVNDVAVANSGGSTVSILINQSLDPPDDEDPDEPGPDLDCTWSPLGGGVGSQGWEAVHDLAVFDDGTGPALYAAGWFATAGGRTVNNIARWDGTQWSALGGGTGGEFPQVWALAEYDDGNGPALFAGGRFTTVDGEPANHIARWDGTSWSPLGSGTNGTVHALTVYDDGSGPVLVVGGNFSEAGGDAVENHAFWDGTQWSSIGNGITGEVRSLIAHDDGHGPAVFAGGSFDIYEDENVNIMCWQPGEGLSPLVWGVQNLVHDLAVFDEGDGPALFAGGALLYAGLIEIDDVARWAGGQWTPVGSGIHGGIVHVLSSVADLPDVPPSLFAGGSFTETGDGPADRIVRLDGSHWSSLDTGMNGTVRAIVSFDDGSGPALYAAGSFTSAGGGPALRIARGDCILPPDIPGDLNDDGAVNVSDLLILLGAWGDCADPDDCPADLNGDGTVNVSDLLILLSAWG